MLVNFCCMSFQYLVLLVNCCGYIIPASHAFVFILLLATIFLLLLLNKFFPTIFISLQQLLEISVYFFRSWF